MKGSHTVRSESSVRSKLRSRLWWSLGMTGLLCLGLLVGGFGAGSWPWGTASGQTVPRTPPPTFTPTRRATPPATPTDTPLPTATATLAPGAPTPVPRADPVIALSAEPQTVGPGDSVSLTCQVVNRGNAPASGVKVMLDISWPLAAKTISSSKGVAQLGEGSALVSVDSLQPGEEAMMVLQALVEENASPGMTLRYRARLSFEGGSRESNEAIVTLPWALLPATGK